MSRRKPKIKKINSGDSVTIMPYDYESMFNKAGKEITEEEIENHSPFASQENYIDKKRLEQQNKIDAGTVIKPKPAEIVYGHEMPINMEMINHIIKETTKIVTATLKPQLDRIEQHEVGRPQDYMEQSALNVNGFNELEMDIQELKKRLEDVEKNLSNKSEYWNKKIEDLLLI
jgi:molybdopterin converting factor small subunit